MDQGTRPSKSGGIVASLFARVDRGERALADLKAAGFTRVEISSVGADGDAAGGNAHVGAPTTAVYDVAQEGRPSKSAPSTTSTSASTAPAGSPFFREQDSTASSFGDELIRLGFSKGAAHHLVDGIVRGEAFVTADAGGGIDRAVAILNRYGADIRYAAAIQATPAASGPTQAQIDEAATKQAQDDDREIQLRAERLVVNKQRVQHGEARIRKEIVTEMKTIDVPVSHEELVIERHAVTDLDGVESTAPIEEETIRIPLTEERVHVSKETIVQEEVEVGICRIEGTERITDTVQHEELRIDGAAPRPDAAKRAPDYP